MSSYPIIKIPTALERAYRSEPVLANFEQPAACPPTSAPQYFNLPMLALETVSAVLMGGLCWSLSSWFIGIFTGGGGLLLVVAHAFAMSRTYPDRWYLYRAASERHLQKQWETQFSQARSARLQTADGIARYRRQKVSAVLKHTQTNGEGARSLTPAAAQFAQVLTEWFPGHIHTDAGLTLIDRASHLHISIEIDEPYQEINGEIQATHYLGSTLDQRQNNFYLDQGWVVIRFSSLQTTDTPDSCGKVIAELAAELLQETAWLIPFEAVENLIATQQWTRSEAQQLAKLAQRQYA
jgi:hypothetical protein